MIPDDNQMIIREKEKTLKANLDQVKLESQTYTRLVNQLVGDHAEELDNFITDVDKLIRDLKRGKITQYSELRLEMKCLTLAHAMYKAADGLAILGGQSDVAKIMREEAFSRAYSKVTDGTIPDKKAEADQRIVTEKMIEGLMQRAYSGLAIKVKSGNRLLEAIKKILSSRMVVKEVFRRDSSAMDGLDLEELMEDDELE